MTYMPEGSDAYPDEDSVEWGRDEAATTDGQRHRVVTIASDDVVTVAEREELERRGATTAWISMDVEHVVDVAERQ